ncbi:uncharacterized protein BO87DRAFT_388954 [Aspergillus neoniger CBS 115656]|uniref:Uncharacterized protein n=1 Tax=Aspergillus neoniger (strain CBS 115656) TaxID=1448310 RepID=A0A318YBK2_ASPNB|nr:hypothetical protein BO87DRAFT_388954 [Aspergillus neoniger CBS 115656]PYH31735.1 hypothetical protein BO87DRAFT_388954 [Aspergillus neoniger CBS 115656]
MYVFLASPGRGDPIIYLMQADEMSKLIFMGLDLNHASWQGILLLLLLLLLYISTIKHVFNHYLLHLGNPPTKFDGGREMPTTPARRELQTANQHEKRHYLAFPETGQSTLGFLFFFSFPLVETVMDEGNRIKSEMGEFPSISIMSSSFPPGLCRKSFAGGTGRGRRNPRSSLKVQG